MQYEISSGAFLTRDVGTDGGTTIQAINLDTLAAVILQADPVSGATLEQALGGYLGIDLATTVPDDLAALLPAISATVDGLVTTQRASDADRARSILSTKDNA